MQATATRRDFLLLAGVQHRTGRWALTRRLTNRPYLVSWVLRDNRTAVPRTDIEVPDADTVRFS
jgi:hypothetical protein